MQKLKSLPLQQEAAVEQPLQPFPLQQEDSVAQPLQPVVGSGNTRPVFPVVAAP